MKATHVRLDLLRLLATGLVCCSFASTSAKPMPEQPYVPGDRGERPKNERLLPDEFLRGYDPITVYFQSDRGPARGPADEGEKLLRVEPSWPGAWFWLDRRTLEFRPAEPWPALARFAVTGGGAHRILTTMMAAPSSTAPPSGSTDLAPFRSFTLSFPQELRLDELRKMLHLEIRDLPGVSGLPERDLTHFELAEIPRTSARDGATYIVTLPRAVPEGKLLRVTLSLALGGSGPTLWEGRLSTRLPFHLVSIQCGPSQFTVTGGASLAKDTALACGNQGELPQFVFSAPVDGLTATALSELVRLSPAVDDLGFEVFGTRVQLRGHFVPDTLYRLRIGPAPIHDDSGRPLASPGEVTVFAYRGWKTPFLRYSRATALVEANGPRMLPLVGYGDRRADVRIYRIDPLYTGLWPFPSSPVMVDERSAPPFPGEEPTVPVTPGSIGRDQLVENIRLLGSPLVSKIVRLPLDKQTGTTRFGLDLGPLLDPVVGPRKPGTYLVGLRRLTGSAERSYVRVQITNLSLTAVEERDHVVLFVRTLDHVQPVPGATIRLDGTRCVDFFGLGPRCLKYGPASVSVTTDGKGRAEIGLLPDWTQVSRVSVQSGNDVLVIDPSDPPPRFVSNHWSYSSRWLSWLTSKPPAPVNDQLLGFVFTERPIYRPGETVYLKGYVRQKTAGKLTKPTGTFGLEVAGPSGQHWKFPVRFTRTAGFSAEFKPKKDAPTGTYVATVYRLKPYQGIATRSFRIEAYRIPTFEVRLYAPDKVRLDGPFAVKAVAHYYAGGNVAGQPIQWTVRRWPYHPIPKGRKGWMFASSTQFSRPGQSRMPEELSRQARLDGRGADTMTVNPALDLDGSPRIYHFEVTVTGPDNQPVSAVRNVKALPPFILGMKLKRYLEHATAIRPKIIAVGVDDKDLGGQKVVVELYKRIWRSTLRETHFASGQAKYVTEQDDVKLLTKTIVTNAASPVVPVLPIHGAGVYLVKLVARDKLGRLQTLSADLYVGGKGPMAWQKPHEGVFTVTPDQVTYDPGDTAKLVIESPFQTGQALVVVEEPEQNTYAWLPVSQGKAVAQVPITDANAPNLPVHVVLMRGRLGIGTRADGRYRPETLASSLDLTVTPMKNSIAVGIEHPDTARPGAKVDFTLTLKDDRGRPLAGEVTFWLVDEAVLSLAKEASLDPLKSFVTWNQSTTSIRDSRNWVIGQLFPEEEDPGGDGEGEAAAPVSTKRIVRKNFKTVPYYRATLEVPSSGRLVIPVKLSDDLTNFRVRAVAASGYTRFGFRENVIHVRLPLIVQPQLPRLVRQGDKFWAGGIARLIEGKGGPGKVDISLSGPVTGGQKVQSIDLEPNAAESVVFPLTARAANSAKATFMKIRVGVTRNSDGQGDAFEEKIPVLPDRQLERFAYIARFKPGAVKLKPFPEPPRPGTASEQVMVTAVPGVLELAAGLDYLAAYPHGCLEQRLSQVWPVIMEAELLHSFGLDAEYGPKVSGAVQQFLADLPKFQDDQGLFAFWPGDHGDLQLTADTVALLGRAKSAGFAVDPKVEGRAVRVLQASLRSDWHGLWPDYAWDQRTDALEALSAIGLLNEPYVIDLFHDKDDMDATSLADLALAMSVRPHVYGKELKSLKHDLWNSVVLKLVRGKRVFDGIRDRRTGWRANYLGSDTSTTAMVMEALLTLDPTNPEHALLRDGLVSYATGEGFGDTYDNREAITALAMYLEQGRDPLPTSTVTAGDVRLHLDTTHKAAQHTFELNAPPPVTVTGTEVGARVAYTYLPNTPGDHVTAQHQGLLVSRSYTLVHADGTMDTPVDDEAGATRRIKLGDILEIHARLQTLKDRYFVAFVVPFAAGLEPMNPALATSGANARPSQADSIAPTYVQRLDGEVRYYFDDLPRGSYVFHFRVRAATEGSFVQPAPWAELMYKPAVRGRGDGMRIVVTGPHQK